jgi:hypothetical protein|tara:strand:- start:6057 stop:6770 length:714 start_codon:yes stop_codon:yes gene_type:complete
MRYINLSNNKDRDAKVIFKSIVSLSSVHMAMETGAFVENRRLLKGTSQNSIVSLMKEFKDSAQLADAIIANDPEVDLELEGKTLNVSDRAYINQDEEVVYKIRKNEKVFLPDGSLKDERVPRYLDANIATEHAVNWTGKMIPRKKLYNKVVFVRNYQIFHVNGLTYDFLFNMANELAQKDSMMMMAGGETGDEPLVFNDGGKPYRAFLEGRVDELKYCLILHLSDLELKPIVDENKS